MSRKKSVVDMSVFYRQVHTRRQGPELVLHDDDGEELDRLVGDITPERLKLAVERAAEQIMKRKAKQ